MMMGRLRLKTRILILVAGTVMGIAVLLVAAISLLARATIDQQVRADSRVTSGFLTQYLRERTRSLSDQSRLLALQPVLKGYIQSADAPTLAGIAEDFRRQLHADGVVLTDRDGRVLGGTDATPRVDLSHDPGIAAALDGSDWSGVVVHQGKILLKVCVPISIYHNVWGTLTCSSVLNDTVAQEFKESLSGSEVAFLCRGRVIAATAALPDRLSLADKGPVAIRAGTATYFALYSPFPGTRRDAGAGFVVLRPSNAVASLYAPYRIVLALIVIATLFAALFAGAGIARSITGPLETIVDAARVLREGGWPDLLAVHGKDEVALLQTVFNEMTSSLQTQQERLLKLIDTDPLTGLDNHRRFQERVVQETRRCGVSGDALAIVLFDFDHFQEINQKQGHASGDALLTRFSEILRATLPDVSVVARYGGDEFAVLLPRHDAAAAERIAIELLDAYAVDTGNASGQQSLSLSAGCAEFGGRTTEAEGLILAAELAVSQAKQLGRNQACRFDSVPGIGEQADPYQLHKFFKDGSLAAIQALAAAVDAKDPYTQGHSQRVAAYASDLARALGMTVAEVELVQIAGTLHDVGKIGVPDAILKKPARLDDQERAVMQTHPVLGEVIVRKVPQLAAALPGVRHHHERWDGAGYPDGFKGEEIPPLARLLAIADTYDAMTSSRPYRNGLPSETALAEITRGAGTQHDPEMALRFVELMQARQSVQRVDETIVCRAA